MKNIKVGVNGYGVIGKLVADAVTLIINVKKIKK